MSLALNKAQFALFIQFLKDSAMMRCVDDLPMKKAATHIGRHDNHSVWVLGEKLQVDSNGELLPENETQLFWHGSSLEENIGNVRVQLDEIVPRIVTPLNTSALRRYIICSYVPYIHSYYKPTMS